MNLSDIFPHRLDEVHWTDLYPKGFAEFRKKYLKLAKTHEAGWLYVQFTSNSNNMDRNAWQAVDHHDCVGTYSYPLKYVLQYPADIWYGSGARFLRVLKDVSKNSLCLQHIQNETQAENLLVKIGFTYPEARTAITLVRKHYKDRIKGANQWAKIAFQAIQVDILSPPIEIEKPGMWSKGGPKYRIRTGQEQTALLLKAGYDSIEDRAKNSTAAVINDREPEQMVFLNRGAFRIVDVFALRPGIPDKELPSMTTNNPDTTCIVRPLAATIAKVMDDQIIEWGNDPKVFKRVGFDACYKYYWTKKGRRIEIDFDRPSSYYQNKTIGEKKHKEDKLSNSFYTKIKVQTEYGELKERIPSDEPFKDGIVYLARKWADIQQKPINPDWMPENAESFMANINAEKHAYYDKEAQRKRQETLAALPKYLENIEWVANRVGKEFTPPETEDQNLLLVELMKMGSGIVRREGFKNKPLSEFMEHWYQTASQWLEGSEETLIDQVHQLGEIILAAAKQTSAEWWITRGPDMFGSIRADMIEKDAM